MSFGTASGIRAPTASTRCWQPYTSIPVAIDDSPKLPLGTTAFSNPRLRACSSTGKTPGTFRRAPLRANSPRKIVR